MYILRHGGDLERDLFRSFSWCDFMYMTPALTVARDFMLESSFTVNERTSSQQGIPVTVVHRPVDSASGIPGRTTTYVPGRVGRMSVPGTHLAEIMMLESLGCALFMDL